MKSFTKPPRLRHGDVIGICAPASPARPASDLDRGVRYLEQLGYRVKLARNVLKRRGYLAGTDAERAADLNELFRDRHVRAIFTVRGGYGSQHILPRLDYAAIGRNPKILVGYSDITALHFAFLRKAGLISFSGPMVAVEMGSSLTGESEEEFWGMLTSANAPPPIGRTHRSIVRRKGAKSGILIGGNLSLISTLVGTPYIPLLNNPLWIMEEIDERPYRINRMLQQMKLAGLFDSASGVALGDFTGCGPAKGKPSLTLREVFTETLRDYNFPTASGFHFGHIKRSIAFPVGVRARLDGSKERLSFLEAAVSH